MASKAAPLTAGATSAKTGKYFGVFRSCSPRRRLRCSVCATSHCTPFPKSSLQPLREPRASQPHTRRLCRELSGRDDILTQQHLRTQERKASDGKEIRNAQHAFPALRPAAGVLGQGVIRSEPGGGVGLSMQEDDHTPFSSLLGVKRDVWQMPKTWHGSDA